MFPMHTKSTDVLGVDSVILLGTAQKRMRMITGRDAKSAGEEV